jgi:predicted nucleic acid-binding protein
MADQPKVFLDTSALFAGLWSDSGGARQILQLAEAGLVTLTVSPQVLSEIENNLRRKAPDLLGKLAVLLDRVKLVIMETAPETRYEASLLLTGHPGDGRVLADAWITQACGRHCPFHWARPAISCCGSDRTTLKKIP